jgi:hypothetical protein
MTLARLSDALSFFENLQWLPAGAGYAFGLGGLKLAQLTTSSPFIT